MTHRLLGLSLAAFALAACGPAATAAEGTPTSITLYGRTLSFTLPAGMTLVYDKGNDSNVLKEYVPQGETFTNWTRMVTIQAYRGLGRDPASTAEIARRAFYPAACKVGPIYQDNGERSVGDGLQRSLVVIGCASLPPGAYSEALAGAGEQDFILIFRDDETIYTLNYAVRGKPFTGKAPPIDIATAEAVIKNMFGEVRLTR